MKMDEESKMFKWGVGLAIFVFLLTAALQVSFRTNDKARARIRARIVETQQDIAERRAAFASFVRPEILRNLVFNIYPKSETVNFNKSISVNNLDVVK